MNSNCLGEKENLIDILCNAVDTDSQSSISSIITTYRRCDYE